MSKRSVLVTAVAAALGGYALAHRLRRQAGAPGSRRRSLDDLGLRPQLVTDLASTIEEPSSSVWPWLVQRPPPRHGSSNRYRGRCRDHLGNRRTIAPRGVDSRNDP